MRDFGDGLWVVGRKDHRCDACHARIPKSEKHYNYRGMYDGDWQNWRMHEECFKAFNTAGDGEFMGGEFPVPERIRETQVPA